MERWRRVCDGEAEESVRWRGGGVCEYCVPGYMGYLQDHF
jgi:hypothetical protein